MFLSRRSFITNAALGSAGLTLVSSGMTGCGGAETEQPLKAGFARIKITPPIGTAMTGFGDRDYDPSGCKGIHDELYVRALYLSQGKQDVLIMGFDLLFFSRDEADRFKGAVSRKLDLAASQILLNTSHTHTGPKVGTWIYTPSDRLYLQFLEDSIVQAAIKARESACEVTMWAGATRSELPMNRRKKLPNGIVDFAPNPDGIVYDSLPICLFKDSNGKPVCLLFSVSTHPSTVKGVERSYWISADYPGAAMAMLDKHLGIQASLFLQGAAGDSKPSVIGKGEEQWRAGTWDDVTRAGEIVANEIIPILENGLVKVEPEFGAFSVDMELPLTQPLSRDEYEEFVINPQAHSECILEAMKRWAEEKISMIDRGFALPTSVPISVHGVKLGKGLRLIGVEGELVAELGLLIENFYSDGITYSMGYSNGTQLYLPTSRMLDEGGYEVESYWEYRLPAPLVKGIENILSQTLQELWDQGIQ